MQIPKHRMQRTMAQQMKRVLAVLTLALAIYMAGSIFLLARESNLAVRELNQMSDLYLDELDNRFQRISRYLFATMMEKDSPDSVFWNYVDVMEKEGMSDYPMMMLRRLFLSTAWEYGEEYCFFLYLEEQDKYYQLSINSEGSYNGKESVEQAVLEQVSALNDTKISYSVKKKWNIISDGEESYMCKIARNHGVYLGCYVNVRSILEPFSSIVTGKNGYVRLVDEQGKTVGMLTSQGISETGLEADTADRFPLKNHCPRLRFIFR